MEECVRILHFEDNPYDGRLVALELEDQKFPARITFVQTKEDYLAAIARRDFDIIISDYRIPGYSGDEALKVAREQCPEIPFIMTTGELGEERAVETLKRGAVDYVLKDRLFRIVPAITRALEEARNQQKRREAETALRESEEEYRLLFENATDGIVLAEYVPPGEPAGTFLRVNEILCRMLGYTHEEMLQLTPLDIRASAEPPRRSDELAAVEEGGSIRVEAALVRKDGREIVAEIQAARFKHRGKDVVLSNVRDITERKAIEQQLRRQAALIDLSPDAIIVRKLDGTILSWSKGAESLYGWTQAEAVGKTTGELLKTRFPVSFEQVVARLQREGRWSGELRHTTRDGRELIVESRWLIERRDNGGMHESVFMESNVDITGRKRTENALRESESRLLVLAEALPQLVWTADAEGRVDYVNDRWLAYTGQRLEDALGAGGFNAIHPLDRNRVMRQWTTAVRTGEPYETEYRLMDSEGRYRWFLARGLSLRDEHGRIERWFGTTTDIDDQKKLLEQLQQSEERYQNLADAAALDRNKLTAIIETMMQPVIVADPEGRFLAMNRAGLHLHSLRSLDELGDANAVIERYELFYPDGRPVPRGERPFIRVGRGEAVSVELHARDRVSGTTWIGLYTGSPVRNASGQIVLSVLTMQDLTHFRQAERALKESEERFRTLADNIPQLAWMADESGRIFWYNKRWYEYTGTTLQETEGWGWQKLHHPEHVDHVLAKIRGAFQRGEPWEDTFPLRGKEGEYRWFLSRAIPISGSTGKVVRWFGTNTDVTDLRLIEEQLSDARARLDATLDALEIGTWTWDLHTKNFAGDRNLVRLFGISREEGGKGSASTFFDRIHPEDRPLAEAALTRALEKGERYEADYRIVLPDNTVRWVGARGAVYNDPRTGKAEALHGVVVDITERKRAEEQILALNRDLDRRVQERTGQLEKLNKELEAFTYSVSHDLKSPLRMISSFSRLLQEDAADRLTRSQRDHLQLISEGALQMEKLINALLEFSRLSKKSLNITEVDTDALAREVVAEQKQLLAETGREVEVKIRRLPKIHADPLLLRQVFTNVVSNAFKFTQKSKKPRIEIGASPDNACYRYYVRDNGVGFEEKDASKLFNVFQRLHSSDEYEGSGIGLANVRKIIERHGGKVWAEGTPEKGATFYWTLPSTPVNPENP